jgi:hypothetical protein
MTRFSGWLGIAVLALGFAGCDGGSAEPAGGNPTPPSNSFEEDMKKQGDMMKKAGKSPNTLQPKGAPAAPK